MKCCRVKFARASEGTTRRKEMVDLDNLLSSIQAGKADHVLSNSFGRFVFRGLVDVDVAAVELCNEQIHQKDGGCQHLQQCTHME